MEDRHPVAGAITLALAVVGSLCLAVFFWNALSNGFSPGKMGATHPAGSPQYAVFLVGCVIGLFLNWGLAIMALHWMGLLKPRDSNF